jgi:hypothetical protein
MEKIPKHEPLIEDYNDEEVFQNYMEDLRLSPEDFDKKILDVGIVAQVNLLNGQKNTM